MLINRCIVEGGEEMSEKPVILMREPIEFLTKCDDPSVHCT